MKTVGRPIYESGVKCNAVRLENGLYSFLSRERNYLQSESYRIRKWVKRWRERRKRERGGGGLRG